LKEALVKNTADKEQVKKAAQEEARIRQLQIDDVFFLLNHPQGRRFIWRYLGLCGVYRLSYTANSDTNFREGERNIGLKLMNDIMDANPDAYLQMINENKKEKLR
jgi:hypothetical protein